MKKVFSFGLVLIMLLSLMTGVFSFNTGAAAWDGGTASFSLEGSGTAADPYLIGSGADLRYLADEVNMGNKFTGVYFRQIADIDLGNKEWVPIGYKDPYTFQGNYDGNNKSVYNFYISTAHYKTGLFGNVGAASGNLSTECGIANLTVKGTVTVTASSSEIFCVAGVIGRVNYDNYVGANQVYVKNVVSEVAVTAYAFQRGTLVGGVCGLADEALFENVINKGAVNVSEGKTYIPTGGIAGRAESCTFRSCINYGNVKLLSAEKDDQLRAGGIVGMYYKKSINQYLTFEGCVNTASVYAESTYPYKSGDDHHNIILVGGILGGVFYQDQLETPTWPGSTTTWRNYQATFTNCANTGAITGKSPVPAGNITVGGIAGSCYAGVGKEKNDGGFQFIGCASSGTLSNTDSGRSGGITGSFWTSKGANYECLIKNCFSSTFIGGVTTGLKQWSDMCLNSVGDSPAQAQRRAEAILSTATGDNDTLVIVLVSVLAIGVAFVVTRKFIIKSR